RSAKVRRIERVGNYQTRVSGDERATKADKAWPEFTEDAKPLETLSSLQSEETFRNSTTLLISALSVMIFREEIYLSLKANVVCRVICKSAADSRLGRPPAHTINIEQGELSANFKLRRLVRLSLCAATNDEKKHCHSQQNDCVSFHQTNLHCLSSTLAETDLSRRA